MSDIAEVVGRVGKGMELYWFKMIGVKSLRDFEFFLKIFCTKLKIRKLKN